MVDQSILSCCQVGFTLQAILWDIPLESVKPSEVINNINVQPANQTLEHEEPSNLQESWQDLIQYDIIFFWMYKIICVKMYEDLLKILTFLITIKTGKAELRKMLALTVQENDYIQKFWWIASYHKLSFVKPENHTSVNKYSVRLMLSSDFVFNIISSKFWMTAQKSPLSGCDFFSMTFLQQNRQSCEQFKRIEDLQTDSSNSLGFLQSFAKIFRGYGNYLVLIAVYLCRKELAVDRIFFKSAPTWSSDKWCYEWTTEQIKSSKFISDLLSIVLWWF